MSDPIPTKSLLESLIADRQSFIQAGWSQDDHYCLPVRALTIIIDALSAAANATRLYEREIRNGFPITNEEQNLVSTMHAIIHIPEDLTHAV